MGKKRNKRIETPQGYIVATKGKKGVGCRLVWNEGFRGKWQGKIDNAQKFVDSECIRRMDKYTPMLSGMLVKSATLGTKIGQGVIKQIAPYAKYQYYGKLMVSSKTGSSWSKGEKKVLTKTDLKYNKSVHPLAGAFWFERMKTDHLNAILKGAQKWRKEVSNI